MVNATVSIPQNDENEKVNIAAHYHALGFNVLPVGGDKRPLGAWGQWHDTRQTADDVRAMRWNAARGLAAIAGDVSGGLVCVDFDNQPNDRARDRLLAALGLSADYAWLVTTPGGGYHVWLVCPDLPLNGTGRQDRPGTHGGHIELRYHANYTILPPSVHPSGGRYRFAASGYTPPSTPPATVTPAAILAAYDAITVQPEPKPEPAEVQLTAQHALPSDASELLEVEARTRAAIAQRLQKRGQKPGYYCCPQEHGPAGKDFLFNPDPGQPIGGCQGKHAGQLTRWSDLADHLGVNVSAIARDVAHERRGDTVSPRQPFSQDTAARHFPQGLPQPLAQLLRKMHRHSWFANTPNHGPAALVWFAWHELVIAGEIDPDRPISSGELQTLTEHSRQLTRRTVDTGLDQLAALSICTKITLRLYDHSIGQKMYKWHPATRHVYQFQPLVAALPAMLEKLAYRMREAAYSDIPDNVHAEYGLTPAEVAALDDYRADLYADHADQRRTAAETLAYRRDIYEGIYSYQRLQRAAGEALPAGSLPNARAYRKATWAAGLDAAGGERENAYKGAWDAGVSRQTLAKYREDENVIAVPRWSEHPIDPAGDDVLSQIAAIDARALARGFGVELVAASGERVAVRDTSSTDYDDFVASAGGPVTLRIRGANAEKRAELATADELAAAQQHSAQQRHTSQLRQPDPAPKPDTSDTVPDAYSEPFMKDQAHQKLPPGFLPYDQDTGEMLDARALWQALAAHVQGKGENVTFTHYSVPDDRPTEAPAPAERERAQLNAIISEARPATPDGGDHRCYQCGQPASTLSLFGWRCEACHTESIAGGNGLEKTTIRGAHNAA